MLLKQVTKNNLLELNGTGYISEGISKDQKSITLSEYAFNEVTGKFERTSKKTKFDLEKVLQSGHWLAVGIFRARYKVTANEDPKDSGEESGNENTGSLSAEDEKAAKIVATEELVKTIDSDIKSVESQIKKETDNLGEANDELSKLEADKASASKIKSAKTKVTRLENKIKKLNDEVSKMNENKKAAEDDLKALKE